MNKQPEVINNKQPDKKETINFKTFEEKKKSLIPNLPPVKEKKSVVITDELLSKLSIDHEGVMPPDEKVIPPEYYEYYRKECNFDPHFCWVNHEYEDSFKLRGYEYAHTGDPTAEHRHTHWDTLMVIPEDKFQNQWLNGPLMHDRLQVEDPSDPSLAVRSKDNVGEGIEQGGFGYKK